jgi:hypothetical protein
LEERWTGGRVHEVERIQETTLVRVNRKKAKSTHLD